jgi:hypothetical protein
MCGLAAISAACLIFSAGAQNVSFGWQLGAVQSPFKATVLALASAGATLLAPVCFAAVMVCARKRRFGVSLVALVLGTLALTYAAVCSLGTVAGAKDHGNSERSVAAATYADGRAVKDAARAELATLKGQTRQVMERRRELAKLLAGNAVPSTGAKPVQADAQAASLAFYIRAAGWTVTDQAVGTWLSLGMVLFLELAAGLSLTVAAALKPVRLPRPAEASQTAEIPMGPQLRAEPKTAASSERQGKRDDDQDRPPPPAPRKGRPGRPRDIGLGEAVEKIRAQGGKVSGSLNGLSKLIGSRSKTSCHRLLHQLADMGAIKLTATPGGCSVALAA